MQIRINENNEITDYVGVGSIEGGQEYTGEVPEAFYLNFKPSYYLLQDSEIIVNPNYEEPAIDVSEAETPSGPSPEMLAINALGIQLSKYLAGGD